MDGITDEPMRQIQCQIAKPDVIFTEFISAEGFAKKPENFTKKLAFEKNERPVVVQIFGYTPECFYKIVSQLGKMGFDGIDINMGCPAKSVLQRGGGGALIGNYKLAEKIINQCQKAIDDSGRETPLSIKTRIVADEAKNNEWFKFLSNFSLREVTIHGRSLKQGNSGLVDWEKIKKAAEILKGKNILCLGNGGIKSLAEAIQKCRNYDLDGVLIGQAALGNPWIFRNNYQPAKEEILATILKHGKLAWNFYEAPQRSGIRRSPPNRRAKADGEKGYLTVLKHFSWYPRGFKNCKNLKRMLLQTRNLDQLKKVIAEFEQN